MPIPDALAAKLTENSNEELFKILETPVDWRAEVSEFAKRELNRRGITDEQISEYLASLTTYNAEVRRQEGERPLTGFQSFWAFTDGLLLGLIPGLFFIWPTANGHKKDGSPTRAHQAWSCYWTGFAFRIGGLVLYAITVWGKH